MPRNKMKIATPLTVLLLFCAMAALLHPFRAVAKAASAAQDAAPVGQRPPVLGADFFFAGGPPAVIEALQNQEKGEAMAEAFKAAGVKSLRFSSHGYYSAVSPEATAKVKAENKLTNQYEWFPFENYVDYIAEHDFTTVVGVNVEEDPDVAYDMAQQFLRRGLQAKLIAIELSNEPWLNHRPWQPEEYAARAAAVIERLTPLGVRFALPLTVGKEKNTPTKLSDDEWNGRMLRALAARIDLKNRTDIYGVPHLYSRGVRAKSIDYFNKAVRPFAPNMRYLVTEFNIRLSLEGNPHLTNKYAMEFARRLPELMARPEIEAMYVHAVPFHSVLYWANGKKVATVVGYNDPKLKPEDMTRGWHLTPAGKVYGLYSNLAWNGEVVAYGGSEKQRYWAVRDGGGRVVATLLNADKKTVKKRVNIAGQEVELVAPPQTIICSDQVGREIERLSLPH
ncbi:MAG TPA: hypothetical protein VNO70_06985 [Blastocatellia bacterium]|nr:hypothetical protein [Blastocatellia bacterium]